MGELATFGVLNGTSQLLTSYAGHVSRALVYQPTNAQQLQQILQRAQATNRRVTFRAAGLSFDGQGLGDDLVVSLERFDHIELDAIDAAVTVGAGAKWKKVLARTAQHGLLPHILVTAGDATAGGTLSSHSISRFTPTLGREGRFVSRLRLMLPDGSIATCSRQQNSELFSATIGGLGYFGAILDVTYQLFRAPVSAPEIAVETVFEKLTNVDELVTRLVPGAPASPTDDTWSQGRAICAVLYLRGGRRSLLATSRYVERRAIVAPPSVFHSPRSLGHLSLQLMAQVGPLRDVGYRATFGPGFREPQRFLDELHGYTFFQDGNAACRRLGRRIKLGMGIRQQTYFLPCDPRDLASATRGLEQFLDRAEQLISGQRLLPALIDVLYVPPDQEFLLSSSRALPSLAITFTFERLTSARLDAEERVCRELCSVCASQGGRVHLVKQVFADPGVVREMYADVLQDAATLRARIGARGVLRNEFLLRTLGLN